MVRRVDAGAEESDLSTASRAAGVYTQGRRKNAEAFRSARYAGSRTDDGGDFGAQPIFEADLQPEQYAYRRCATVQRSVNTVLIVSGPAILLTVATGGDSSDRRCDKTHLS